MNKSEIDSRYASGFRDSREEVDITRIRRDAERKFRGAVITQASYLQGTRVERILNLFRR